MIRAYIPLRTILPELPAGKIEALIVNDFVKTFCKVPIDRYYNTKSVPGLGKDREFREFLKDRFKIRNPLDLMVLLRWKTRGRRLPFNVKVLILLDFFEKASEWLADSSRSTRYISKSAASVSIAVMDSKVPRNFRSLPLCI